MALQASSVFAAFDLSSQVNELDISSVLEDAVYYDLNLLGSMNVDFGNPVDDIIHYWNEEQLNSDLVTMGASAASDATALTLSTNHGNRLHIGDLLYDTAINTQEVLQVTATGASAVTVTRAYNSTSAASIANGAVLACIRAEQEGSDIDVDRTLNPTVRNNHVHTFAGFDLKISADQIERMRRSSATNEFKDFLARQLAARAIELRINMSRGFLYSEKSSSTGSDTVYRTMAGLRNWIRDNSGVTNASSEAISLSVLNTHNKSVVDTGVFPDRLVIGTDLVSGISAIDSTVRRLRESDKQVGYVVQEILLNQGNMVQVVVESRVKTGDAFLYANDKVRARPFGSQGMYVIAATDFADAKKRRILAKWTTEVRNPGSAAYLRNKTSS
jgi:uncharacterized protein YgiB involved in biofilm formation